MTLTLVYGSPGTGKTTYLARLVNDILKDNEPDDILFSSYSRASSQAIYDKMTEMGYTEKDDLKHFKTSHSLATLTLMKTYGNDNIKFIDTKDYIKFCSENGIEFKVSAKDGKEDGMISTTANPTGNSLFAWWQLLKKRYVTIPEIRKNIRIREDIDYKHQKMFNYMPQQQMVRLFDEWEAYKAENQKYEYDDTIHEIVLRQIPFYDDIKYMLLDEMHDTNALQLEMFKIWMKNVKKTWICYDNCQAIYQFNGADPALIKKLEYQEKIILPKSYRVPKLPWEYATKIAKKIGENDIASVEPTDNIGMVKWIEYSDMFKMLKELNGKAFTLFRTNMEITDFEKEATDYEILTSKIKTGDKNEISKIQEIYDLLLKLHNNEKVSYREMRALILATPASYMKRGVKASFKKGENIYTQRLDSLINDEKNAHFYSLFKDISCTDDVKELISKKDVKLKPKEKNLLLQINKHSKPSESIVKHVGTFHSSKGLEAENVVLFDYNPIQSADIAIELRIIFVGITRTMKNLFIVQTPSTKGLIEKTIYNL